MCFRSIPLRAGGPVHVLLPCANGPADPRRYHQASTLPARFYSDPGVFQACRERVFTVHGSSSGDMDPVKAPGHVHPPHHPRRLPRRAHPPLPRRRRHPPLPLQCLHPPRQHRLRPRRTRTLPHLLLPRPAFRPRRHVSAPCRSSRRPGLPLRERQPPQGSLRHVGQVPLRLDQSRLPRLTISSPTCRPAWRGSPITNSPSSPPAPRTTSSAPTGPSTATTTSKGSTSPSSTPPSTRRSTTATTATELYKWSNLQLGIAKGGEDAFDLPASSPDHAEHVGRYYYWLFPNTMINIYPVGHLGERGGAPLAPDLSKVSFLTYVWDRAAWTAAPGAAWIAWSARTSSWWKPCSAACARASTTGAATPPRASKASTTSTACSPTAWPNAECRMPTA